MVIKALYSIVVWGTSMIGLARTSCMKYFAHDPDTVLLVQISCSVIWYLELIIRLCESVLTKNITLAVQQSVREEVILLDQIKYFSTNTCEWHIYMGKKASGFSFLFKDNELSFLSEAAIKLSTFIASRFVNPLRKPSNLFVFSPLSRICNLMHAGSTWYQGCRTKFQFCVYYFDFKHASIIRYWNSYFNFLC